jgi:hypothetical protein
MNRTVRRPLGKLVSRAVKSQSQKTSMPGPLVGKYAGIQFEASFENKKTATETVPPMPDKEGSRRVEGHYIK